MDRGDDVFDRRHKISGTRSCSNLPDQKEQMLIDPQTHLLRQVSLDLRDHLISQGVPQVNKASVKIDYTKSVIDAPLPNASFAWTPPADASLFKPAAQSQDEEQNPASALVGKPGAEFSDERFVGNDVQSPRLKGHVVVLDFGRPGARLAERNCRRSIN